MFGDSFYDGDDFSDAVIADGALDKKEFYGCSFQGADFTDVYKLQGARFEGCSLISAALNGVTLKNCAFLNCRLDFAGLFATVFDGCKMTGSTFLGCSMASATISGGDWSYTDLRQLHFDKKELREVSFAGADLTGCRFTRCRADGCNFSGALAAGLSFRESDIRGSLLHGLELLRVDLQDAVVDLDQCVAIAGATGARYVP